MALIDLRTESIDALVSALLTLKKELSDPDPDELEYNFEKLWLGEELCDTRDRLESLLDISCLRTSYIPSAEFKECENQMRTNAFLSTINTLQKLMTDSCNTFARKARGFIEERNNKSREDGIRMIPDELLARVFYFVQEPMSMSHVCQRFRRVALENPYLWSRPPSKPRILTVLFLQRSRNSLLDVTIQGAESDGDIVFYEIASLQHMARLGRIKVSECDRETWDILQPEPLDEDNPTPLSALLHAELLQSSSSILDLVNPKLDTIEVDFDFGDPASTLLSDWTSRFSRFLNLKELRLSLKRVPAEVDNTHVLDFQQLSTLHMEFIDSPMATLNSLFCSINAPHLSCLHLHMNTLAEEFPGLIDCWGELRSNDAFWDKLSSLRTVSTIDFDVTDSSAQRSAVIAKRLLKCCPFVEDITIRCNWRSWIPRPKSENPDNDDNNPSNWDDSEMPMNSIWNTPLSLKTLQINESPRSFDDLAFIAKRIRFGPNWKNFRMLQFSVLSLGSETGWKGEYEKIVRPLLSIMEGKMELIGWGERYQ